jgi:hypothetical protein
LHTVVEILEVASLELVDKPSRQFNMWDVLAAIWQGNDSVAQKRIARELNMKGAHLGSSYSLNSG